MIVYGESGDWNGQKGVIGHLNYMYWTGVCGDLVHKEWQGEGVVNVVNKNQRQLKAEFRSGSPKLEVETGRWLMKERGNGVVRYATRQEEKLATSLVSVRHWMGRDRL